MTEKKIFTTSESGIYHVKVCNESLWM